MPKWHIEVRGGSPAWLVRHPDIGKFGAFTQEFTQTFTEEDGLSLVSTLDSKIGQGMNVRVVCEPHQFYGWVGHAHTFFKAMGYG